MEILTFGISYSHVAMGAIISLILIGASVMFFLKVDGYFTFEQSEKRKKEKDND